MTAVNYGLNCKGNLSSNWQSWFCGFWLITSSSLTLNLNWLVFRLTVNLLLTCYSHKRRHLRWIVSFAAWLSHGRYSITTLMPVRACVCVCVTAVVSLSMKLTSLLWQAFWRISVKNMSTDNVNARLLKIISAYSHDERRNVKRKCNFCAWAIISYPSANNKANRNSSKWKKWQNILKKSICRMGDKCFKCFVHPWSFHRTVHLICE